MNEGDWCHVEIPSQDVERTKKFYGEVFGWKFRDIPEMNYTMYETSEGGIGGGVLQHEEAPQHHVNYVLVKDIDPAVARIENNGGSVVVPKKQVGGAGWMAWVKDPDGNVFGLWQGSGQSV